MSGPGAGTQILLGTDTLSAALNATIWRQESPGPGEAEDRAPPIKWALLHPPIPCAFPTWVATSRGSANLTFFRCSPCVLPQERRCDGHVPEHDGLNCFQAVPYPWEWYYLEDPGGRKKSAVLTISRFLSYGAALFLVPRLGLHSQGSTDNLGPDPIWTVTPRRMLLASWVGECSCLQPAEDRINDLFFPN